MCIKPCQEQTLVTLFTTWYLIMYTSPRWLLSLTQMKLYLPAEMLWSRLRVFICFTRFPVLFSPPGSLVKRQLIMVSYYVSEHKRQELRIKSDLKYIFVLPIEHSLQLSFNLYLFKLIQQQPLIMLNLYAHF